MTKSAAIVAFFVASLIVVVATPWCTRDRVEDVSVWKNALAKNIDIVKPGDIVLVHPPWRDDVVRALRTMKELPRNVVVTDAIAPRHGDVLPPIVVVREKNGVELPQNLRDLVDERIDGDIAIGRIAHEGATHVDDAVGGHDLSDAIASATVEVELENHERVVECPWNAIRSRHECAGLPEWMHVGVETLPVGGKNVRCTWSHPTTHGALHVRFPATQLASMLALDLGLTDGAADNAKAAPVFATVSVDGKPLLSATKAPGQRGFVSRSAAIATPNAAHDVEIVVTTPNDGQRHTCFRLVTR